MDLIDPATIVDDDELTAALAYASIQQYAARVASQQAGRPLTPMERELMVHVEALLERRRELRHVRTGF